MTLEVKLENSKQDCLKVSKYNLSLRNDSNNYYLVNSLTCSVLRVPESSPSFIHSLLLKEETPFNITIEEDMKELLLSNGFLVPSYFDEIDWLEKLHWESRHGCESLGIGIIPTLGCNFRCSYCYQKHDNVHTSSELENSIIKYISNNLNGKRLLKVMWFGGEPILRIKSIHNISQRLLCLIKSYNIKYYGTITTNGYLLTDENSSVLLDSGIKDIQVTIDGPPSVHDTRRYLINNQPTFMTILSNLSRVAKMFSQVIIRINIDKRNQDEIFQLLELLIPLKEYIVLAFRPATSPNSPQIEESWCVPPYSYWNLEKQLNVLANQMGFRIIRGYAFPGTSFCSGYQQNSVTIDPYGDVHKCPICIGRRNQRYGILSSNGDIIVEERGIQNQWDKWSPFLDEECRNCKALPLCMGGCLWFIGKDKKTSFQCFAKHRLVEGIVHEELRGVINSNVRKEVILGV